ncbi:MAG TPA: DUF4159 domain-containing protein [Tepidisphaeraceae bacterium]|nr:DUF4159 domain-containing protein [Tepidisphaeraceae bacterium]
MRVVLVFALSLSLVAGARAASLQDVQAAIRKAKEFIYSRQNKNGTWEISPEMEQAMGIEARQKVTDAQWGGLTALCTYSLIVAGDSPNDPRLVRAIKFLKSSHLVGTYALAFRCQLWSVLPPDPVVRIKAHADAMAMMNGMIATGRGAGFYNYVVNYNQYPVPQWWWDLSNGQIAVLGVWACDKTLAPVGAQVPMNYWQIVDQAWRRAQYDDGSWPYSTEDTGEFSARPRLSITAAGAATLFITDEYLHRTDGLECRGYFHDTNAQLAMGYLADHFNDLEDAQPDPYYAFYGLERIGVASGRRFLQSVAQPKLQVDWYERGSDDLIAKQNANGSWGKNDVDDQFSYNPLQLPDTCFAAIFLSRGSAPVLMSKLQYDETFNGQRSESLAWDQRQMDAANITRWISVQTERPLNWQVETLDDPIDDLHQAPILFISGDQELQFTPGELAELRQFIEEGGLVFGNADCASKAFAESFEQIGQKLFPDYQFENLPRTNFLYALGRGRIGQETAVPMRRLSNGVRNLMLLVPTADPARAWQMQSELEHQNQYDLMRDVVFYATDDMRGLHGRGESPFPRPDPKIKPARKIEVARLEWDGNWNPEPAGWQRLAAMLHNAGKAQLQVVSVDPAGGAIPAAAAVADLTGTGQIQLGTIARKNIRDFLDGGGILIVDAAGGNAVFAESAQKELAAIVPAVALTPVDSSDPIFPRVVAWRPYAMHEQETPAMEAITFGGRRCVYFSPGDLAAGLVGQQIDGIVGYTPQTATDIMTNLVLSAGR